MTGVGAAPRSVALAVTLVVVLTVTVLVKIPAWADAPGDVVSASAATFTVDPLLHQPVPGVRATKVLYRSTDANNNANTVSGTILVPVEPYVGKRPIVGYTVGTHGLGDQCAPSAQLANGTDIEAGQILSLLGRGWAVAITDYEGLGTPGQHTYMVGPSMGHAALDMLRAATRLPGSSLATDAPMGVWGYSQGGAAAAWAAQLQPSYAPELHLKGVAAGAVAPDVEAVARQLQGGAFFGLAVATVIGLNAAYPQLDLQSHLTATGHRLVQQNQDQCLVGLLPPFALKTMDDITSPNVFNLPDWQDRFAQSRLGAIPPAAPMLLYHAQFDEVIPYYMAINLRDQYCAAGVTVQWQSYPVEHLATIVPGIAAAIWWLADRFVDQPPVNTCP
jgi:pimeloyl-ACP methyl ester carboxylesterase